MRQFQFVYRFYCKKQKESLFKTNLLFELFFVFKFHLSEFQYLVRYLSNSKIARSRRFRSFQKGILNFQRRLKQFERFAVLLQKALFNLIKTLISISTKSISFKKVSLLKFPATTHLTNLSVFLSFTTSHFQYIPRFY